MNFVCFTGIARRYDLKQEQTHIASPIICYVLCFDPRQLCTSDFQYTRSDEALLAGGSKVESDCRISYGEQIGQCESDSLQHLDFTVPDCND